LSITIKGFLKNTLLDWDGRIASVVFTPGCNFRCPYCHSPHLVYASDEMESIPPETVVDFIRSNRDWVDGLAITGGEPTIQPGLVDFLVMLGQEGIAAKLDTNGTMPDVLEEILERELVEYVAMDVKAPPEKYALVTGVAIDSNIIARSIDMLIDGKVDYEFRTTICPLLLDEGDIAGIARWISGAKRHVLQNFRGGNCLDEKVNAVRPMPVEQLQKCAREAAKYVRECRIRGERLDDDGCDSTLKTQKSVE